MQSTSLEGDDEANGLYAASDEEVRFALQQVRRARHTCPWLCPWMCHCSACELRWCSLQALALNEKLFRMELEVSAQRQRPQQQQRHQWSSPPLPPMHDAGPRALAVSLTVSHQRVANNPKRSNAPRASVSSVSATRQRKANADRLALENARFARRLAGTQPHIPYFRDAGPPGRNRVPGAESRGEREERYERQRFERERRSHVRCSLPTPQRAQPRPPSPHPISHSISHLSRRTS